MMDYQKPEYLLLSEGALERIEAAGRIAVDEYRENLAAEKKAEERRIRRLQAVEYARQNNGGEA